MAIYLFKNGLLLFAFFLSNSLAFADSWYLDFSNKDDLNYLKINQQNFKKNPFSILKARR